MSSADGVGVRLPHCTLLQPGCNPVADLAVISTESNGGTIRAALTGPSGRLSELQHEIRIGDEFALITTSGDADPQGWRAMHEALIASPGYRPGMPILLDHRDLDTTAMSADDARAVGDMAAAYAAAEGASPMAVVVPQAFGLARMAQAEIITERLVRIFHSVDEAFEWTTGL